MYWIAIIIVILLFIIGTLSVCKYRAFLPGLWVGESTFLSRASLRDFQLYIAPGCKQGYLIISDDNGDLISNQALDLSIKYGFMSALNSTRHTRDTYKTNCSFEFDDESSPLPANVMLSVSMIDGTLTLYDDTRIYAYLAKDNLASMAAWED